MKTFKKRVTDLYNSVDDNAIKEGCQIALESSLPDNDPSLRSIILEKLGNFKDNEYVSNFLATEDRLSVLDDLGLTEAFADLYKEDGIVLKQNPLLTNALNQVKAIFENRIEPVAFIAEKFLNTIKPFDYIPEVDNQIKNVTNIIKEHDEDISLMRGKFLLTNSKNNGLFKAILEKIDNYIVDRSISRKVLINELHKYKFEPVFQQLLEILRKYDGNVNSLDELNENGEFNINDISSFLFINEDKISCFYHNGVFYGRDDEKLFTLSEAQINELPESYIQISEYIKRPNVRVNNNRINITLNEQKITFVVNEDRTITSLFNEREITTSPILFLPQTGSFTNKDAGDLNIIGKIWENLASLINISFGKEIKSNVYAGLNASLFRINEKFYVHMINPGMQINDIKEGTGLQVKNTLLEFMNYDISQTLYEFLDGDEAKVAKLRETQGEIRTAIHRLHEQLQKLEYAEKNQLLPTNEIEKSGVRETINNQIGALKTKFSEIDETIKTFNHIQEADVDKVETSSGDIKINDQVKIKGSGTVAKIININSITNVITVLTDEGDTLQTNKEELEIIKDELEAQLSDIEQLANQASNELKGKQNESDEKVDEDLKAHNTVKSVTGNKTVVGKKIISKKTDDNVDIISLAKKAVAELQNPTTKKDTTTPVDIVTLAKKAVAELENPVKKVTEDAKGFDVIKTAKGTKTMPKKAVITDKPNTSDDIVKMAKNAAAELKKKSPKLNV